MFTTNYVKNDHPAYCAGIQTLNLLIASLTPWPLDQGSRPQKTYLLVYILDHSLALSSWLLILPMMGLHTPLLRVLLVPEFSCKLRWASPLAQSRQFWYIPDSWSIFRANRRRIARWPLPPRSVDDAIKHIVATDRLQNFKRDFEALNKIVPLWKDTSKHRIFMQNQNPRIARKLAKIFKTIFLDRHLAIYQTWFAILLDEPFRQS